ncbi:MAG: STAS domain-containing protein [Proteobacteria bacterium]|nr:STAS domain-containing protein [Pseudomonadota bacterium]
MKHQLREDGATLVVTLEGDVDLDSSPEAREVLLKAVGRGRDVLVDMARITYIDSSGIASLVEALQAARLRGRRLALAAVSPAAMRVLSLARLDKVFAIHASVAEALASGG